MNGIVGICYRDGRAVNDDDINSMLDTLVHRGRDAVGVRCEKHVGFGQRMSHTLPEPLPKNLPLLCRGRIIVADARIDNRAELAEILHLSPNSTQAMHDFEFILAAYEKWGEDCASHLLGDFSFAIWDRETQTLFAARDHFGVKPFFYYESSREFAFASEVKALLRVNGVPHRLNQTRVADFLMPMYEDTTATLYEGIVHLPPAHTFVLKSGSCVVRKYWTLNDELDRTTTQRSDWPEAYREAFLTAVKCRLRTSSRVGVLVSGGLDSSSVFCSANHLLGDSAPATLRMFSGVFDHATKSDERKFGNIVAQHCGATPIYGYPDQLSPLTDWDATAGFEDEPLSNPQMALRWSLYPFARENNVRVMLDGYGGDGVISNGLGLLTELLLRGRWRTVYKEASGVAQRHHRSMPHLIWKYGIKPALPYRLQRAWERLRRKQFLTLSNIPLQKNFVRRVHVRERIAAFDKAYPKPPRTLCESHYREILFGVYPSAFECFNRTSALFGIEPRHPYFDKRLVALTLSAPADEN